ncbi:MAG: LysR family transcriptional regulator substrate-binding protein, partial [Methylotenera sp.]
PELMRGLEQGYIDIGIFVLPAISEQLSVTPLFEDEIVLINARDGDKFVGPVTPHYLSQLPIILYQSGASTRQVTDQWFAQAGHKALVTMEFGNVEAIKTMVVTGSGQALVPKMALQSSESNDIAIQSLSPKLFRQIGLVTHKNRPPSEIVQTVISALYALRPAA